MTFSDYQQQVLRTAHVLPDNVQNSIHMVLGITSEWLETIEVAMQSMVASSIDEQIKQTELLKKEVGDILWYVAGLAHFNALDFNRNADDASYTIDKALECLNSVFKAHWIYGRSMADPDKTGVPPIIQVQTAIYSIIYWIEKGCPFKIEDVMETNIDKLKARYPEKFEASLANNRKEDMV